jgi:hypothetical protein
MLARVHGIAAASLKHPIISGPCHQPGPKSETNSLNRPESRCSSYHQDPPTFPKQPLFRLAAPILAFRFRNGTVSQVLMRRPGKVECRRTPRGTTVDGGDTLLISLPTDLHICSNLVAVSYGELPFLGVDFRGL